MKAQIFTDYFYSKGYFSEYLPNEFSIFGIKDTFSKKRLAMKSRIAIR